MGLTDVPIPAEILSGSADALERLPVSQLRDLRRQLQRREDDLSLLRRMVQGRLDIVGAEQERRRLGAPGDLGELLAELPATLAGPVESSVPARATRGPTDEPDRELCDELDQLCGINDLRRVPDLSLDDLGVLSARLVVLERSTSQRRQELHRALDAVSAELAHRYATGQASVDDLLDAETGLGLPPPSA